MVPVRMRTARIDADELTRPTALHSRTDEQLSQLGSAGIEELFRRHQPALYRFCLGITTHSEEAADAMQAVWERALLTFSGDKVVLKVRPWLYTVARNECIDRIRGRRTDSMVDVTDVDLPAGLTPEEQLESHSEVEALLGDLAMLSERQRSALVLREFAGYDGDELADALSTSRSRALGLVADARRSLIDRRSGRALACSAVQHDLGRMRRRSNGVQAHLDSCADCRCFEHRRRGRSLSSLAIVPLLLTRSLAERLSAVLGLPTAGVAKAAVAGVLVTGSVGLVGPRLDHDPRPAGAAPRAMTAQIADAAAAPASGAARSARAVRRATTPRDAGSSRSSRRPRIAVPERAPATPSRGPSVAPVADASPGVSAPTSQPTLGAAVRKVTATTDRTLATVQGVATAVDTIVVTPVIATADSTADRTLAAAQPVETAVDTAVAALPTPR